ncbi:MAG TPA: HD domain-containing protein [Candidatus Saccharimonadales bacterium]|nr:HD domain-containing protein [Candidatus Saccharimonadales bacterium]
MQKQKLTGRDLEFLYEIGTLRFIPRSWSRFLNPDYQNLAEHHFRVVWIALIIAAREGVENTEKIVKLALMHDVAESRTGDADYLSRQYVERNEDLGMKDIFKDTALEQEFLELWKEYSAKKSLEAKIVKDADNLDVDFEIKEQEAKGDKSGVGWKKQRNEVMKKRFFTPTAKEMWYAIQKSDPHDWHYKGRNRFNGGDWKQK